LISASESRSWRCAGNARYSFTVTGTNALCPAGGENGDRASSQKLTDLRIFYGPRNEQAEGMRLGHND
jgi:hypothetical protein